MNIKKNRIKNIALAIVVFLATILAVWVAIPSSSLSKRDLPSKPFEKNQDLVSYIDYSPNLRFQNDKNVLFFKANWCGTCTIADKNFLDELKDIPEYLTIYRADYEQENTLKQKYGVTIQHTFVQVDHEGNALKKWAGSYTIEEILKELV